MRVEAAEYILDNDLDPAVRYVTVTYTHTYTHTHTHLPREVRV